MSVKFIREIDWDFLTVVAVMSIFGDSFFFDAYTRCERNHAR